MLFKGAGGGEVTGAGLKGSMMAPGGDWLLMGADGFGRIDVRLFTKTVHGALIYMQYYRLLELSPDVRSILDGGDGRTGHGEQYFFTNPRLQTGDARYLWVNQTMFIGQGQLSAGPRVDYRVYSIVNG